MRERRTLDIQESASLRLTKTAETLRSNGETIYNFGIGEPDFTTPERIINAAFQKAREGATHYTPSAGIMPLRIKIAEKLKNKNGIDATPESVLVTPTKFAVYLSLMTMTKPGDEVLLPDPYYLSYPDIIKLAGAKPIFLKTDDEYEIDLDLASKLVTDRTKVFFINSPANPTGKVYSEKSLRKLCDFVIENDLTLVSDEIYEDLIFEGKHFSPASIAEMAERTLTVNGFSKSYAMTGWRIGYLQGPQKIISDCNKIQQQSITCAPSISQYGALEALKSDAEVIQFREAFRKRRDLVARLLDEIDGLSFRKPEGTFYAFPSFDGPFHVDEFCSELLNDQHVIVTPGSAFTSLKTSSFRISFATSDAIIESGIQKLGQFLTKKTAV